MNININAWTIWVLSNNFIPFHFNSYIPRVRIWTKMRCRCVVRRQTVLTVREHQYTNLKNSKRIWMICTLGPPPDISGRFVPFSCQVYWLKSYASLSQQKGLCLLILHYFRLVKLSCTDVYNLRFSNKFRAIWRKLLAKTIFCIV